MGRNKLLLGLGGETVVRRTVKAVLAAGIGPVTVVLGYEADRVRTELQGLSCRIAVNPDHARGVATSIHVGVAQVKAEADADAMVIVLADMPFVTASMIATVAERHRSTGAPVVVSRYGETEAPPTLFARRLFPELLASDVERCARQVARRHEHEAVVVTWPAAALRDLDVADDYEHARAELAEG
jgi:molybdenum cofactor cytidylyltransferase